MQDVNEILEWGHSNLKLPYLRLAEEITAAGQGKGTSEKIKLLFFPFKTEGRVAADVSNHFYPPLMDSPVINAIMLVTESTKKNILRIYTEEYDIRTLSDDPSKSNPEMFVKDYKPTPTKLETIEKLMQERKYQEILDFMENEQGVAWNCLKIGSLKMLEEMKIIEEVSAETGDFLAFLFQTCESLQKLYSNGDFYVYPEERFPLFYSWQNYFGYWTKNIDYKKLKRLVSQLLWNQQFNFLLEARKRPIFNLLINVKKGIMSMELVPPQVPSTSDSSNDKVISRRWNSVKSIELLKNLTKSNSLKQFFLNLIPYLGTLAIARPRKNQKSKPQKKKKRQSGIASFITDDMIANIMADFTGDLNDGDRIWTLILENARIDNNPIIGFESEIREGFPAHITGLNENKLKNALDRAIPFNNVKMKIALDHYYLIKLRGEIRRLKLPQLLQKLEIFFLKGISITPKPRFLKNVEDKGLLNTLIYSTSKRKKKELHKQNTL